MRQQLQQLPNEKAIFLLIMLIHDGGGVEELLRFLPQEESEPLSHIANEIGGDSSSRRQILPQLVQELKTILKNQNHSTLDQLDPEWLVEFFKNESPQIISTILRNFSRPVAERIAAVLPPHIAQRLPMRNNHVHPTIQQIVKENLESKCPVLSDEIPTEINTESFTRLRTEELFALIRELGFYELAVAFRGAGRGPLTELCRQLKQDEAERLIGTIRRLEDVSHEETKRAQRTIRSTSSGHSSKSELIDEAGIFILRNAFQLCSQELRQQLAYRLPRRVGQRLLQNGTQIINELEQLQLQHRLAQTLQLLASQGYVGTHWQQIPIALPPLPETEPSENAEAEFSQEEYT